VNIALGAAENGGVVGEDTDPAPVYGTVTGDNAVARRPQAVFDQHAELVEAACVKEQFYTLPRRQLALLVLAGDFILTTPQGGHFFSLAELFDTLFHFLPPTKRFWQSHV
jgi:hypothetical protein